MLRGLDPAEQRVVVAYAEGDGAAWTEAASAAGAADPEGFGERGRRNAKRLAGSPPNSTGLPHSAARLPA
ncbi:hypothetical protein ACGF3G_41335 [Streptomyces sp. NPDC048179]|uniref:hypothetical protein n=1 Tax=Streptomyces sp. NPDC048179 TaxID=3365506 RepID=UPI00371C8BDD